MIGDLRYPGDESQCPNCKSETLEDNRLITYTTVYKFLAVCSLIFMFLNILFAPVLVVLSIVFRALGKRGNFFDLDDIY